MEDEALLEREPDDMDDPMEGEAEMRAEPGPMIPEQVAAAGKDLAFEVEGGKLARIASDCLEAYKRDKEERKDWEEAFDRIMAMVKLKRETKSFPWPGASNVKYPIIMKAALKFGSRAYPAIVNGSDVVKSAAVGKDETGEKRKRGDRVSTHMNYQLLLEMPEWDRETDRLCHSLPLQGTMFRQVIWDSEYARPLTTLLSGKELVVTQSAKDLETVPHFAKEFKLFVHQIKEKMADRRYREVEIGLDGAKEDENAGEQDMLECHCRYDLDGDGYDEPYIAVIHKESEVLLSLKAGFWPSSVKRGEPSEEHPYGRVLRIRRHVEFVKYEFLPDPDGNFYAIGFGQLLLEHSDMVNSMFNQLLDAATDQNAGGGFVARNGAALGGGTMEFDIGEWKNVNIDSDDIRKAFFSRPTSQPSPVLFNLLGMLLDAAKDISSDQDIMDGTVPANTPATTVLAAIEEGMKVFSSIYKRIYRSITQEFRLIAKLNAAYLTPEQYNEVLDEGPQLDPNTGQPVMDPMTGQPVQNGADPRADYSTQDKDIVPVADPSMTTSAQKLSRAQFLMQIGAGNPLLDQKEIMRRVLEAGSIDDIESLMPKPDPMAQEMQAEQMKTQLRAAMAEILKDEASATDSMMAARLKFIEGDVKVQEQIVQAAAMRQSMMNMMGIFNGQGQAQINGPGMGGMGGLPQPPAGQGPVPGAGPQGGFQPMPMGGPPMGGQGPGPGYAGPGGDQGYGEDIPPPL